MKNPIKFTFTIPMSETKVSTAGLVETVQIGEYTIQGQYWAKHEFDYDRILWNGCDIYDLAMNTNEGEAIREFIDSATDDHVSYLISEKFNHDYTND